MKKMTKPLYIYLILFLSTTVIGTIFLYLPITGKQPISLIDAFFTSSSAFTVTGLTTIDISTQFNVFGELIILFLIQIGGLGIVTVTLLTLIILNKKISYKNRHLLMVTWNIDKPGGVIKLIIQLVIYSLCSELVGAILLSLSFIPKFGLYKGSIISVFTSISAFNNAGFALFKNNMIGFNNDPVINIVLSILIIMGGIGYFVFIDLITCRRIRKLNLHSKVVLSTTVFLIIFGTIGFYLLEQHNTLENMTILEKLGTSFFQSVTTRTAGFNTIDIGHIQTATSILVMLLMFIGGGPISAAGGVKVTTIVLVLIFIKSTLNNSKYPAIFHRSISERLLKLAVSIVILSSVFIICNASIISVINPHLPFMKILFEVVSAFGTVGLTMDLTSTYQTFTKLLIIIAMLVGKIGLLTIISTFVKNKSQKFYYAKGNIYL